MITTTTTTVLTADSEFSPFVATTNHLPTNQQPAMGEVVLLSTKAYPAPSSYNVIC